MLMIIELIVSNDKCILMTNNTTMTVIVSYAYELFSSAIPGNR